MLLHLNPADTFEFSYLPLNDGYWFDLPDGVSVEVRVMHTPGHTRGSHRLRRGRPRGTLR